MKRVLRILIGHDTSPEKAQKRERKKEQHFADTAKATATATLSRKSCEWRMKKLQAASISWCSIWMLAAGVRKCTNSGAAVLLSSKFPQRRITNFLIVVGGSADFSLMLRLVSLICTDACALESRCLLVLLRDVMSRSGGGNACVNLSLPMGFE